MLDLILSIPTAMYVAAARQMVLPNELSHVWPEMMVTVARGHVGQGEEDSNNRGRFLTRIRRGGPGGPWCAAFVSECLEDSWQRLNGLGPCPVKRSHGARKLFRAVGRAGRVLDAPKPGAVACWARGRDGWQGHVGIVSRLGDNGQWWVIEGNIGPFPALVTEREVSGRRRLIGFAELPR